MKKALKTGIDNLKILELKTLIIIVVISLITNYTTGIHWFILIILLYISLIIYFLFSEKTNEKNEISTNPYALIFKTNKGNLIINNPFRGLFIIGSAGSGKSESIAVPALEQFIEKNYSGVVYDFKYPSLGNEVETFLNTKTSDVKHYHVTFDTNYESNKINPIDPKYMPNSSYAREYSQTIISNLMRETIKRPDFFSRSATDILTACMWFLRDEHPDMCDIPHLFALITSNDEKLFKLLQTNMMTAQMTISVFNALEKGASNQVAGVLGTLQGAIAQINTPELMHVFSANEVPLQINDPENPIILTVGNNPTLNTTLSPLCSLIITVVTKLMNQPNLHPSFVMLDEAPTIYIPNLEVLPNTGRSNKISTVIMCQDISQLTDGYGKEKADVLFSSCNNHFYGRVSSSQTSEILSKQFGKKDVTYMTQSSNNPSGLFSKGNGSTGTSQSIQERDIIKPSDFLNFEVGNFAGIAVETNKQSFNAKFMDIKRGEQKTLPKNTENIDYLKYYRKVREDINKILDNEKPGLITPIISSEETFQLDEIDEEEFI